MAATNENYLAKIQARLEASLSPEEREAISIKVVPKIKCITIDSDSEEEPVILDPTDSEASSPQIIPRSQSRHPFDIDCLLQRPPVSTSTLLSNLQRLQNQIPPRAPLPPKKRRENYRVLYNPDPPELSPSLDETHLIFFHNGRISDCLESCERGLPPRPIPRPLENQVWLYQTLDPIVWEDDEIEEEDENQEVTDEDYDGEVEDEDYDVDEEDYDPQDEY